MSLCEFFFSVLQQIFPGLWSHIWESINFSLNSFWAACFFFVLNRLSLLVRQFNFSLNLALRPCSWFISYWKKCSRTSFFVQRGPPQFFANSTFSYYSPISDALLLSTQAGFLAPQLLVIVWVQAWIGNCFNSVTFPTRKSFLIRCLDYLSKCMGIFWKWSSIFFHSFLSTWLILCSIRWGTGYLFLSNQSHQAISLQWSSTIHMFELWIRSLMSQFRSVWKFLFCYMSWVWSIIVSTLCVSCLDAKAILWNSSFSIKIFQKVDSKKLVSIWTYEQTSNFHT